MRIAVSQRVVIDPVTGERRDALDQRWALFLSAAGCVSIAVPNAEALLPAFLEEIRPTGVLLTGGNHLVAVGGDAPERDVLEEALLRFAIARDLPLIGVCRGMQIIQAYFGITCVPVEGHVAPVQTIKLEGRRITVNSYHRFGTRESAPGLHVTGRAEDGVIKAVRAERARLCGIMWHPERIFPPRADEVARFRDFFGGAA